MSSKIILVHEESGYTLKNGGVVLQGITDVERVVEDGVPVVKVKAVLSKKEYVTEVPSSMVLVVGPEGESLKHGDQFIEGLVDIKEKDGVLEMTLEVASEDYGPKRAAKKVAPKVEEKKVVKPVVQKPVDKLED
jgi:hypothetical protein